MIWGAVQLQAPDPAALHPTGTIDNVTAKTQDFQATQREQVIYRT